MNQDQKPVEINPLLHARHSSRIMDPGTPVPKSLTIQLLEAARWAPSSGNHQPWHYLFFDDTVPGARQKARECLDESNQIGQTGRLS